ncbi:hypothetical protein Ade02nite_19500 [Paractinoplanes deccanensis]|uniref:Uncharacterized protein n=1 Tax=Paractinoplanes deccanensis TaxID=113561 RepID=A0ABQ3XZY5_9ACTN|nr:hypothetical protein [Actinoplanes deccanensis]GID73309.1 hypothetical protein Ade02nite_19500 [Actinoplanes deccanensis]
MVNVLDTIDRATDGLCPCGAEPREGSAYCSYDCEPTHLRCDTDTSTHGPYAGAYRCSPDGLDDPWADVTDTWLLAARDAQVQRST